MKKFKHGKRMLLLMRDLDNNNICFCVSNDGFFTNCYIEIWKKQRFTRLLESKELQEIK